jgi:prepilin-type N-terminal cleavage/methylation domain-containing protein
MRHTKHETMKPAEAGFSMVELLVVMGVITIMLAAGVPAMNKHTGTAKLRQAVEEVSGSMKLARQRAVATSGNVVIQFEPGNGRFYMFDDLNEDGLRDEDETMAGPYCVPHGVDLASVGFTDEQVTFGPRGAASESESVVLRNSASNAQTVSVTAATGLVYVSDIYRFEEGERKE